MKSNQLAACLVLVGMSALGTAHASPDTQSGIYFGATYNNVKFKAAGETGPTLGAISATVGTRFNKHFALEFRAGTGINDDDFDGLKFEIDYVLGLYALGTLPLNNSGLSVYGSLGHSRIDLRANLDGMTATGEQEGISYGAGLQYSTQLVSYRAGYETLLKKSGISASGLTAGVYLNF